VQLLPPNSHTPEQPAPNSPAAPSGVVCSEIVSCPKCNSTKCVRLWRVEVVLPGDNSDNSTKGWRWGCLNCGADWLERITANTEVRHGEDKKGHSNG
jgi:hypothetical protein